MKICCCVGSGHHFIQTTAVIDWCHQYGPNSGIWVLTKNAWYKLGTPAASYKEIFQTASLRFNMCKAAIDIVQEDPEMDISEAIERVLGAYANEPKLHPRIRSFLASQIETWVKVQTLTCSLVFWISISCNLIVAQHTISPHSLSKEGDIVCREITPDWANLKP